MDTFWALGKTKIAVRLLIIYTVVNWVTSVPLVYRFGFTGAMVGSVIVLYLSLPLTWYQMNKIVHIEVIKNIWPALFSSVIAGLVTWQLSKTFIIDIVTLGMALLAGGLVYGCLLIAIERKRLLDDARWLWNKVRC